MTSIHDIVLPFSKKIKSHARSSFYYNITHGDETRDKFAVCKLCTTKEVIIKMKNGNTTGLKRHLQSRHRYEFEQLFNEECLMAPASRSSESTRPSTSKGLESSTKIVANVSCYNSYFT